MTSLLAKAKALGGKRRIVVYDIGPQDIKLALAWAKGEIGIRQVAHAYDIKNYTGSYVYIRIARALREHIQGVDK